MVFDTQEQVAYFPDRVFSDHVAPNARHEDAAHGNAAHENATPVEAGRTPRLEIGEGTNIGHFNHIYATRNIKIGRHVLTADRVYISDNLHGYEDVDTPVLRQPVRQIAPVEIGDGSWLGEGVCVIGAKIGKGCVIGANAVVTKDVPDYSVAVGIPARIIKRYYPETKQWITLK